MKPLLSLILIASMLVASVVPAYVYAEPLETDAEPPHECAQTDEAIIPVSDDAQDSCTSRREDQSDEREDSTLWSGVCARRTRVGRRCGSSFRFLGAFERTANLPGWLSS